MKTRSALYADLFRHSVRIPPQQYQVVETLRRAGTLSRTDIAKTLDYSRALIGGVVKDLIDSGILQEGDDAESTGGRRARQLRFNGAFGLVLGIDMGATSLDIALADFQGRRLMRHAEPLDVRDGPQVVMPRVLDICRAMVQPHATFDKVLAVGIGVPGPVDFADGMLIAPPIMPGWESYALRAALRAVFPLATVVIDNDVNVMALGELREGMGRGFENFIFTKVGTGIGAGIVVDGRIYRGRDGCAGDIGHIQADRSGPLCHCGNIGCIESIASGSAIGRRAMQVAADGTSPYLAAQLKRGALHLTAEDVGIAAANGDRVAMQIIKESGSLLGEVLAGIVNFFNPEMILIGGGVSRIGSQFLASIRQSILSRSTPLSTTQLRIDYAQMGDDAGVTGAVALALEHVFIADPR